MFMYQKKRPEVHTLVNNKILWVVTNIFKEYTASILYVQDYSLSRMVCVHTKTQCL